MSLDYSELKPVQEQIRGTQHVIQTIGTYGSVFDPFVQYISNGIDAGADKIMIEVIPERRSIVITDNGNGMTREKLASLPSNIGESEKRYASTKQGEHPKIGLHAYGTYAYQTWVGPRTGELVVISRPRGQETYNVLIRRYDGPREGSVRREDVEYGRFSHGTRVIVNNVRDDVIGLLKGAGGDKKIKKQLSDTFDICLRRNHAKIFVNGSSSDNLALPLEYRGELILDETVPVEYVDETGQKRTGEVQFHIVGSPEGSGRTRLCLQDARVLTSMSDVEQLDYIPFNSPVIGGYINSVDVLWPTGEKHGIQIDENRFQPFKAAIDFKKDFLLQNVERLLQSRDVSADKMANDLLLDLYRAELGERLPRGRQLPSPIDKNEGKEKIDPARKPHRILNPPFAARLVEFPAHEADMLSKVDGNIIYVNKDSDFYQQAVSAGSREEQRYLLGLLSRETRFAKLVQLMYKGTTPTPDIIHASEEAAFIAFRTVSKKRGL